MANYTDTYNLTLPEEDDFFDIQVFNENFKTIDTILVENENVTVNIDTKIGSNTDNGTETVFGKLNQIQAATAHSGSIVKSIQRVSFSISADGGSDSKTINVVDPQKCIVLFHRLGDSTGRDAFISYSLTERNLSISSTSAANGNVTIEFQIIELY